MFEEYSESNEIYPHLSTFVRIYKLSLLFFFVRTLNQLVVKISRRISPNFVLHGSRHDRYQAS